MKIKDPIIIVRDLLVEDWDPNKTSIAEQPKIHTGWYDRGSPFPEVSITNAEEGVLHAGASGHSAGTGSGGVAQYRSGSMLVNCWAGHYGSLEGAGHDGEDVSPKAASWEMAQEIHRIIQENGTGTTADDGSKQLHSLAATDARRMVDDDHDPSLFRYEVTVEYTYATRTE